MSRNSVNLTHEQAERAKERSPEFEAGYQLGWWHQPMPEGSVNQDFEAGYTKGWNDKALDRR